MTDEKRNNVSMKEAVETLNQISANPNTPKTLKKTIVDLVSGLEDTEYSLSVRAANAISMLDDVVQDPNIPSYMRVILWQAVSKLESIRE